MADEITGPRCYPLSRPSPNVHSLKAVPGGQFVKRHPQRGDVTSTLSDGTEVTGGAGTQRTYKPMRK